MEGDQQTPYESVFTQWDSNSTVRTHPRRMLDEVEEGMTLFSAELMPCTTHPLVVAHGLDAVNELLTRRLYTYLDFTMILEQQYINPTLIRISENRTGVRFSEGMRRDAHFIYCDEAYHALNAVDLKHQVEACTATRSSITARPAFTATLRLAKRRLPRSIWPAVDLCFAIVSETLISGVLSSLPRDSTVVTAVRESIADHAVDERKHHAYFSRLAERFWPQLNSSEQRTLGPLFADFIVGFLRPDLTAYRQILHTMALQETDAEQILAESHPPAETTADIRRAARATVKLLERIGVLRDPFVADYFHRSGLIDDAVVNAAASREH
ncbi:diiron oxygenase [Micromonospora taraxaci]|uniref:diiron oxygenase n=1 Tax=Micromonospora taraxaci TaxID=1316803 RepID=UPI00340545E3